MTPSDSIKARAKEIDKLKEMKKQGYAMIQECEEHIEKELAKPFWQRKQLYDTNKLSVGIMKSTYASFHLGRLDNNQ